MASDLQSVASDLLSAVAVLLTLLVRDAVRDRKFKKIREEQNENFTCQFSDERKRHLSEVRDAVRDIKKDIE